MYIIAKIIVDVNTEAADKIGMELAKDYIADAAETFTEITVE